MHAMHHRNDRPAASMRAFRRLRSRRLKPGLIALAAVLLAGGLAPAEAQDALYIDEQGTVKIQELEVQGTIKAQKFKGDGSELTGLTTKQHYGIQVTPGLFEVHTRVLWDLGWMEPGYGDGNGKFTYWEEPKPLVYGYNRKRFLAPLKTGAYGIPEVQTGATRKVRLYVNYGHQWECGGTVIVRIGNVDFSLPHISGFYGDMAANWSDFKTETEYGHLGHTEIKVFIKDFVSKGGECGPGPGTGPNRPKGVMYRIEAHFYDQFPG